MSQLPSGGGEDRDGGAGGRHKYEAESETRRVWD